MLRKTITSLAQLLSIYFRTQAHYSHDMRAHHCPENSRVDGTLVYSNVYVVENKTFS